MNNYKVKSIIITLLLEYLREFILKEKCFSIGHYISVLQKITDLINPLSVIAFVGSFFKNIEILLCNAISQDLNNRITKFCIAFCR